MVRARARVPETRARTGDGARVFAYQSSRPCVRARACEPSLALLRRPHVHHTLAYTPRSLSRAKRGPDTHTRASPRSLARLLSLASAGQRPRAQTRDQRACFCTISRHNTRRLLATAAAAREQQQRCRSGGEGRRRRRRERRRTTDRAAAAAWRCGWTTPRAQQQRQQQHQHHHRQHQQHHQQHQQQQKQAPSPPPMPPPPPKTTAASPRCCAPTSPTASSAASARCPCRPPSPCRARTS